MITITMDTSPISVNHMYGARGKMRFLRKEGKDYKKQLAELAEGETDEMYDGDMSMEIVYYFKDRRRRDVTNYEKCVLDALSGIVYKDDCQVTDITLRKRLDKAFPRTVIKIWRNDGRS